MSEHFTHPNGFRHLFPALLLALLLASCGGKDAPVERATVQDSFPLSIDGETVQTRIALTQSEQRRGLMHVENLPADSGMLFPYRYPQRMSFYMRNTPTPLDIGFFDADGVLREVYPLFPYDETSVRSRRDDLRYALEVNQGWFREHGIHPGARMNLGELAAALEARGADPAAFGLGE